MPSWVNATSFQGDREISVNPYFLEHPDDVIGTLTKTSSPYGFDLTCAPDENKPLVETLKSLTDTLEKVYTPAEGLPVPKQVDIAENVQPLSFFVENNEIKFFNGNSTIPAKIPLENRPMILQAIQLRDDVRNVLNLQVDNCTEEQLSIAQLHLQSTYDDFVARFGHIAKNKQLKELFKDDSAYPLLRSLENYDKDGNFVGTSEIFTERTIDNYQPPTHADTLDEALAISMQEQGVGSY